MTEFEKLFALRNKLVSRRRAIVESYQATNAQEMTGDTFAKVQGAIDAVDRAIADEKAAASGAPHHPHAAGTSSAAVSIRSQENPGTAR